MSKTWKDTIEYRRILEILNDYWVDEPDEAAVTVDMQFQHLDGKTQTKRVVWKNPRLTDESLQGLDIGELFSKEKMRYGEDSNHQ